MQLRAVADISAAEWVSGLSSRQVTTFGPSTFEAYARLRFIPDPSWDGQTEADVALPDDHLSDLDQARRAFDQLAQHTATADHCYVGLWDGYPYEHLAGSGHRANLHLPDRSFLLVEGPLEALRAWEIDLGRGGPLVPPALVWPADHAWCFVSDVDPHWAGIGASSSAIQHLLADPVLDVVGADPDLPQPYYS